jgi:hypothetical protein
VKRRGTGLPALESFRGRTKGRRAALLPQPHRPSVILSGARRRSEESLPDGCLSRAAPGDSSVVASLLPQHDNIEAIRSEPRSARRNPVLNRSERPSEPCPERSQRSSRMGLPAFKRSEGSKGDTTHLQRLPLCAAIVHLLPCGGGARRGPLATPHRHHHSPSPSAGSCPERSRRKG